MSGKKMADSGYQYDVPADRSRVARTSGYKQKPLGPSDEDRLRWQRFLAELPDRIARIRYDEAPLLCPMCGSTTEPVIERRQCAGCKRSLPVSAFRRDRRKPAGRAYRCKECRRGTENMARKRRRITRPFLVFGRRAS